MDDTCELSLILPAFNEAAGIAQAVIEADDALSRLGVTYEIIVVDDGSDDGSSEQINAIQNIRLIRFGENRGSGSARKAGSFAAKGRVIVWTDTDMTYPNDQIPQLVKELDGYDHVVGARTSEQGTMKVFRVPTKWFIRKLASYLVEKDIPDLNSGLRAFRADVGRQYLHLLPPGFSCVTTLTMAFLANGYSVKYVPIDYFERAGTSKFHWYRDTQRYLLQVVRMMLSYNPLRIFLPLGIILGAAGMAKLGFDWSQRDFRLAANTLLLLFASFQVLAIGLLADLIVRVTKPEHEVEPASHSTAG